jgi:hypothetical protein
LTPRSLGWIRGAPRVRAHARRRAPRGSERQSHLLVSGGGLTFTATSKHSSGRAVDVIVGDGNLKHLRTRARWIAFRRWVSGYEGGRFRLVGEALLLAAERAQDAGR